VIPLVTHDQQCLSWQKRASMCHSPLRMAYKPGIVLQRCGVISLVTLPLFALGASWLVLYRCAPSPSCEIHCSCDVYSQCEMAFVSLLLLLLLLLLLMCLLCAGA
jgi:hypothetical protein